MDAALTSLPENNQPKPISPNLVGNTAPTTTNGTTAKNNNNISSASKLPRKKNSTSLPAPKVSSNNINQINNNNNANNISDSSSRSNTRDNEDVAEDDNNNNNQQLPVIDVDLLSSPDQQRQPQSNNNNAENNRRSTVVPVNTGGKTTNNTNKQYNGPTSPLASTSASKMNPQNVVAAAAPQQQQQQQQQMISNNSNNISFTTITSNNNNMNATTTSNKKPPGSSNFAVLPSQQSIFRTSGGGGGGASAGATTTSKSTNNNNNNNNAVAAANDDDEPKPKHYVQQTIRFGLSNETGLKLTIAEKEHKIEELNHKCQTLERELNHLRRTQEELQSSRGDQADRMARYQESMLEVMKESARTHRREARRAHHNKQFELGHQTVMSTPMGQRDVWVHGNRMRELHSQLDMVTARIGYVENVKANAERAKKNQVKAQQQREREEDAALGENSNPGTTTGGGFFFPFGQDLALMDYEEEIEKYKNELVTLRQMETQMKGELDNAFATEKVSFLKEKARLQYEDQSEFAAVPAIGIGRYVLMYLLGKGGFSEVWRAFDLREGRHVACKIHRIRKEWSHQARETYMRHARRELDIQRSLDHPRLTRLYDVFEYNPNENSNNPNNSNMALDSAQITGESIFVSVMEYSAGDDLDTHLRKVRTMREVDARIVFMQIVSCLRHLAEQKEPIIHYDLKPANILFHSALGTCLDIKITDFGLSKIIAEGAGSDDNRIDLTSPGAGTYWYLPPECFSDAKNSKISPKVDIWAAGVIFYQMLYGKRPFADGESQRRIWTEQLIVRNANKLEFPDKPAASEAAKALIRRCLTPTEDDRPDIIQLSNDPYLRQASRRKRTASNTTTTATVPTISTSTAVSVVGNNSNNNNNMGNPVGLYSGVSTIGGNNNNNGGMMMMSMQNNNNNNNNNFADGAQNNNNNNNNNRYSFGAGGGGGGFNLNNNYNNNNNNNNVGPRVPPQPQLGNLDFKIPMNPPNQ